MATACGNCLYHKVTPITYNSICGCLEPCGGDHFCLASPIMFFNPITGKMEQEIWPKSWEWCGSINTGECAKYKELSDEGKALKALLSEGK